MPADSDASPEANIIRLKCFRNELSHSVSTGIPNSEFEDKWNKISSSLQALEASVYQKRIPVLKNDPIDHETRRLVAEQVEQWRRVQQHDESDPNSKNLFSRLPDKIPEQLMFGRTKEIEQVKEIVQSGTVSVALITGGPGFGKTTVANKVAYELAKPENNRTVFFCSLLTKKTLNDVITEMIHSSGTIQPAQLPENPEKWIKDWSKQVQTQVTFVLDNADGVLESGDRGSFLSILSAIRMLSKQNVTFVITTRNTISDPVLQSREVRLNPLSTEEAKKHSCFSGQRSRCPREAFQHRTNSGALRRGSYGPLHCWLIALRLHRGKAHKTLGGGASNSSGRRSNVTGKSNQDLHRSFDKRPTRRLRSHVCVSWPI